MKKKIFLLLGVLSLIFSLSSCIDLSDLFSGPNISEEGRKLDYVYDDSEYEEVKAYMNQMKTIVNNSYSHSYTDFSKLWNKYETFMYDVATYRSIEYIKFCMGDDDAMDRYLEFDDILIELTKFQSEIFSLVYDSSFKNQFFAGLTEEQIQEYLEGNFSDEYYEIEAANEDIVAEYELLEEDEINSKTPELYLDFVNNNKRLAVAAGYSNYMTYAYDYSYGRDFTTSDAEIFSNYVKEYIVPIVFDLTDELMTEIEALGTSDYNDLYYFISNSYQDYENKFEDYAKYMGGNYYSSYLDLWDNGYYYFSNDDNAQEGAFTTYLYNVQSPAVYFGPGYQNIMTTVHEFGHYYAAKARGNMGGALDLSETQSQGNEMLFLAYYEDKGGISTVLGDIITKYYLVNALSTVLIATLVDDFERTVYQTNITSEYDFDSIYRNLCDEYGGYTNLSELMGGSPEDYWKLVAITSPGYYISYAVSLIPSINIYTIADKDLDEAKDIYFNICNYDYMNMEFVDVIEGAGLSNPFNVESFENIVNIF